MKKCLFGLVIFAAIIVALATIIEKPNYIELD